MLSVEQTGEKFRLETFFRARELCVEVTRRIAAKVVAGMNERDGQQLIKEEFSRVGATKFWHPSKFRVGRETMKTFRDLPDQEVRLAEGDLFFLDVGPVIDEHEADFGDTFVLGAEAREAAGVEATNREATAREVATIEATAREAARIEATARGTVATIEASARKTVARPCAIPGGDVLGAAAREIWHQCAKEWRARNLSGLALLEHARSLSEEMGFELNPQMAGHRLGDFPHALFSKERLFALNLVPSQNLWVLEIHVVSAELQRGAFFEDILR